MKRKIDENEWDDKTGWICAGLVYVMLKHFVDRYNIFFAYAPSRINKNIHTTAINFVMAAFLVLQLTLLFFSLLRYGLFGVTIFALVGFVLTFLLVVFQASFRWFRSLAPITYRVRQDKTNRPERIDLKSPQLNVDDPLLADYAADTAHFYFVCCLVASLFPLLVSHCTVDPLSSLDMHHLLVQ